MEEERTPEEKLPEDQVSEDIAPADRAPEEKEKEPLGPALRIEGVLLPGLPEGETLDLVLERGRVLVLLSSEEDAVSRLWRILCAQERWQGGSVEMLGHAVDPAGILDAFAQGVGRVETVGFIHDLTLWEQILLGQETLWNGLFRWKQRGRARLLDLSERYAMEVDLSLPTQEATGLALRQVELLRVLFRGAELLLLDEPAAGLLPQEAEAFFLSLRKAAEQGDTIIYHTHRRDWCRHADLCLTQGEDGRIQEMEPTRETMERENDSAEPQARIFRGTQLNQRGTYLEARNLSVRGRGGKMRVHDVSLRVRQGEVLGITALPGHGLEELEAVWVGRRRPASGELYAGSFSLSHLYPEELEQVGVGYLPSIRSCRGRIPELTTAENAVLERRRQQRFAPHGWLAPAAVEEYTREILERHIPSAEPWQEMGRWTPENQQKAVLARLLALDPEALILSSPTMDLDASTRQELIEWLRAQKRGERALLLFTRDLEELLALSDRILVLRGGRIVGEADAGLTDAATLGLWMMGGMEREA